jgi:F0F1-type ATP synthase membrane subunit c/vacuolar-type H+-ATPase subunit K
MLQVGFAVGFVATVDSNEISIGNSIKLRLLLDDAKPIESIDISALAKDFMIYNQHQFSSYRNVNGVVQAETGWNVVLMPKKEGEFIIPAIYLETDKGGFSTQEIKITVKGTKQGGQKSADNIGISLISIVSKSKAYVNEPIIYTLKIISYKNIANIVLDDIKSSDAIIEKIGEPKQYNQVLGGVNAHIIEIRYAVTALRAGKIVIAPASMHGELQVPVLQPQRQQRFGVFNDMFLDNAVELKPFSLQSDKISIEALAQPVKTNNWLPARSLEISEKWDDVHNVKVGETIVRKIKISAIGAFAKQLPSTKDFMEVANVKSYANKPTFTDQFNQDENTIVGVREEEYSLVPEKAGTFTLPAIKISWWNLQTKKLETATLPSKSITVLAAANATNPNVTIDYSAENATQAVAADPKSQPKTAIYLLIGALVGVIVSLVAFIMYLVIRKPNITRTTKLHKARSKIKPEITVATAFDLRKLILQHAVKNWRAPRDITLNRLADTLTNNNFIYDMPSYCILSDNINAAMYANANTDISTLVVQWEDFKKTVRKNQKSTKQRVNSEYDANINPT